MLHLRNVVHRDDANPEHLMTIVRLLGLTGLLAVATGADLSAQTREVAGLYQCLGGRCAEKPVATPMIRSYGDSLECSNERAEGLSLGQIVGRGGTVTIRCFGQSGRLSPSGRLQWEDGIVWQRIPCSAADPRSWADKATAPRPGCAGS
jgi:hypothetical protein